ncbi:hypothetical protein GHT06_013977 [Daphnia sinensis]|uniref:Uncharacterized protein n=1 Tax=Daphnia sinensis TaxID=1820382 RepID=A0AAD5KSS8_9CRUS|nr:hypothetical protein GHT06_013977 [Daphnia sinensis]
MAIFNTWSELGSYSSYNTKTVSVITSRSRNGRTVLCLRLLKAIDTHKIASCHNRVHVLLTLISVSYYWLRDTVCTVFEWMSKLDHQAEYHDLAKDCTLCGFIVW